MAVPLGDIQSALSPSVPESTPSTQAYQVENDSD